MGVEMEKLHDLLRHYIVRSGNTIYGLAKQSGVNRSTLQKIILGNMSLSEDVLTKILPELKLSPAEEQRLCLFQQMQTLGNDTYQEYAALQKFLEQVSERIDRQLSVGASCAVSTPPHIYLYAFFRFCSKRGGICVASFSGRAQSNYALPERLLFS